MRAREFIAEGSRGGVRSAPSHEFERAHPGLVMPGGRGDMYWGRYYDHYRVSSLAGMSPEDIDKVDDIGFFGNVPIFSAYTDYDREKLKAIMKKLKMNPSEQISNGSHEPTDTNHTSPMKSFKGYKR